MTRLDKQYSFWRVINVVLIIIKYGNYFCVDLSRVEQWRRAGVEANVRDAESL